VLEPQI